MNTQNNEQSLFADPKWASLWQMIQETSAQMKETDKQMKETDRKIKELRDLFTTQWGKLVEEMTRPAVLSLFKESGVDITQVFEGPRSGKAEGHDLEIDVILCNCTEVVAIEVKTTCWNKHIDHFLEQMEYFKKAFPLFADKKVYAAIAALTYNEHSDIYAQKQGLYVLHPKGEGLFDLQEPKTRKIF